MFCGFEHSFLKTKKGLFGFGRNNCFQLGIGPNKNTESLPKISPFDSEVISISCGCDHTIALTKEGVFSWGGNNYGQLGLDDNENYIPKRISFFDHYEVISISCGGYHSLFLTSEGLFSCGRNTHGSLGLGHNQNEITPKKINFSLKNEVISISCGYSHSIVLTKEGLYSFGYNEYEQLGIGLGSNRDQNTPEKISFFDELEVISISCGFAHSIVLTKEGLFSWGRNFDGQLGLGHFDNENTPKKISFFNKHEVISISCGYNHSIVWTNEGLFSWGRNSHGQLGIHMDSKNENTPKKISFFDDHEVIHISCGGYHSIALTNEGIYSWGDNSYGSLGLGHYQNENKPKKIESIDSKDIIFEQRRAPLMWELQRIIWIGKHDIV